MKPAARARPLAGKKKPKRNYLLLFVVNTARVREGKRKVINFCKVFRCRFFFSLLLPRGGILLLFPFKLIPQMCNISIDKKAPNKQPFLAVQLINARRTSEWRAVGNYFLSRL